MTFTYKISNDKYLNILLLNKRLFNIPYSILGSYGQLYWELWIYPKKRGFK